MLYVFVFCSEPRCELEYHEMFQKYIMASSKHYRLPKSFLEYILSLKTEHLLADSSLDENQTASMKVLRSNFQHQIMAFVRKKKVSGDSCTCVWNVLVCAAHMCMYLHV